MQTIDKHCIQYHIEDSPEHHHQHGTVGIAGGSHQTGEIEGKRSHKHTRQYYHHIFVCIADRFGSGTESYQYFIHIDIGKRTCQATQQKGENGAVA